MEPQYAGITPHIINEKIDAGAILQHIRPEIKERDSIHDVGCRAVKTATETAIKVLHRLEEKSKLEGQQQRIAGKLFLEKDFKLHHLRVTNILIKNGFFKESLDNRDLFKDPSLFSNVG
jgi:methionyl-tRNA formyltransferase